jgi:ferredoxin
MLATGSTSACCRPPGRRAGRRCTPRHAPAAACSSSRGWLGAFTCSGSSDNPIDLDLCTRCNACIEACPEGAIGFDYQVDLARLQEPPRLRARVRSGRRDRLRAHAGGDRRELRPRAGPARAACLHDAPAAAGLPARGSDERAGQGRAALRELAANSRSRVLPLPPSSARTAATNRSAAPPASTSARHARSAATPRARAKRPARAAPHPGTRWCLCRAGQRGRRRRRRAHLCVGCGACSTVCPSGAMSFAYPGTVDQGKRLRTMLTAYAQAGGRDAALLLHSEGAGAALLDDLGRAARTDRSVRGVPARVLPVAVWHTASVGLDLWLRPSRRAPARSGCCSPTKRRPEYRQALAEQMAVAQAMLTAWAMPARTCADRSARCARPGRARRGAAGTGGPGREDARRALRCRPTSAPRWSWRIDHLLAQAPQARDEIALPAAGAPFGSLVVDAQQVHAVPELRQRLPRGALADNPDKPQLRFIEKNCVQCGLCASTCPERHHAAAPAVAGRRRQGAQGRARAERGRALQAASAAASPSARCGDREHARQAERPPGLPGRGGRPPEDVRRLPRDRHPHQPDEVRITDL